MEPKPELRELVTRFLEANARFEERANAARFAQRLLEEADEVKADAERALVKAGRHVDGSARYLHTSAGILSGKVLKVGPNHCDIVDVIEV